MIQFERENITVFQSSLYMTTSAIINSEEAIIMTDPNWLPNEVEEIKNYINENLGDKQLYIIYTHSDFDHIIGAGAFPDAKVIASKQFVNNPNPHKEEKVQKIHKFDSGNYIQRNYTPTYPAVDIIVSDEGEKLEIGPLTLTFYHATGHTNDGLFTVIEPYGIFLSGDYLSDVEFPFIFSSYKDYVTTMKTAEQILVKHDIHVHVPGHGSTTEKLEEINNRLHVSKHYLNELVQEDNDLENYLRKRFTFFEGIKSVHTENVKIAKREVNSTDK
ncbi:MBL fold metallo-hydrolase [Virgibacillus flavescens]|uniref:MBL fold metallo-hydrolase n=1 Tax=Virgibacillus flavescens TaxID=1611422 RepID=UPI003D355312